MAGGRAECGVGGMIECRVRGRNRVVRSITH